MLQFTLVPNYKMQKAGSPSVQQPKKTAHSRKKNITGMHGSPSLQCSPAGICKKCSVFGNMYSLLIKFFKTKSRSIYQQV